MENIIFNHEGAEADQAIEDFMEKWGNFFGQVKKVVDEHRSLQQQVAQLEEERSQLMAKRNDEWSSRVTYENVVDQIASNEDPAQRDQSRKLIEPLLKKSMVTQFRKDIKKRVKELNEESGNTFNNYGTYTEVHPGGININNNKENAGH